MEKLSFDLGVQVCELNGHPFRFNPTDPNVYNRLMKAADQIRAVESEYARKARELGEAEDRIAGTSHFLKMMEEMDSEVKKILNGVFPGNDFFTIFEGINITALRPDGGRVVNGFFEAIQPLVISGMREVLHADQAAVEKYAGEYE